MREHDISKPSLLRLKVAMKRISPVGLALIIVSSVLISHTDALAQDRLAQQTEAATDPVTVAARSVPARSSTTTEEDFDQFKAVVAAQQQRIGLTLKQHSTRLANGAHQLKGLP